jgi:hypothetical protein
LFAQEEVRFVDDDAIHPTVERFGFFEVVEFLIDEGEGLLGNVFGSISVADDTERQIVGRVPGCGEQLVESLFAASRIFSGGNLRYYMGQFGVFDARFASFSSVTAQRICLGGRYLWGHLGGAFGCFGAPWVGTRCVSRCRFGGNLA